MNILISGSTGLLGSTLYDFFTAREHKCFRLTQDNAWNAVQKSDTSCFNGIDIFIHAGANTDVENCEKFPDKCYRDNYSLTKALASLCEKSNIKLIFISSTGVYGSHKVSPYCEYDEILPTTIHHTSKYLAELAVKKASIQNLIIRTGWLFGGSTSNKKNFVYNRISEGQHLSSAGLHMLSNSDQYGNPTCVTDFSNQLQILIDNKCSGIFNVVSNGYASRFEYSSSIIRYANIPITVEPVPSSQFNRFAKVSNNEMATNWKLKNLEIDVMRDWRTSLKDYINQYMITKR